MSASGAVPYDLSFFGHGDDTADQAAFDIPASTFAQLTSSMATSTASTTDDVVFPLLLQTVDYLESLLA